MDKTKDEFLEMMKRELEEAGLFQEDKDPYEYKYGKYIVIKERDTDYEEVFGVYDYEIDALRRLRDEKKKHRNLCVIKADIEYIDVMGSKFINKYDEINYK
ncbi:hypothetical protein [Clostridium sp. D53t1_180928_C8]|uniref:hypothetical protein n=1 Tax=Clostridium sp. D53t1_180928_C8 TaxID=2787101 RepID=UPI0018AB91BE|nr:hypothetical protein [Clostridium sp. D53t1_180928_C8]